MNAKGGDCPARGDWSSMCQLADGKRRVRKCSWSRCIETASITENGYVLIF